MNHENDSRNTEFGRQPVPPKTKTNWMTLFMVGLIALVGGMAIGWLVDKPRDQKTATVQVTDLCGDTAEAKAARNLAWSTMNQDLSSSPTTMEGDAGKVLQYMLRTDSPDSLRVRMFSRFMGKSVVQFQSKPEFNTWKMSFLLGDDVARLNAVTQLLEGDQAYAQIMQCLMKDTERMKKMIAGERIPLEE